MFDRPIGRRRGLTALVAFVLLARALPALADDGDVADPFAGDPGVARISVIQGDVAVGRADSGGSYAAAINAPVAVGDYLTTQDGRGEVEFDYGSSLRVAPDTQLRFTVLDPNHHQAQVAAGTVDLRVFRGLAAHPEIQTPAATVRPATNGSFRITVTADGDTQVTARVGRATVVTATGTQTLDPGPTLLVTGSANDPRVSEIDPVALDGFDAFNRSRDAAVERASDWAYVDAGFVGADDLDAYGTWTTLAGYGQVWEPASEPDGWAPYTTGRWIWEPYYGWAWVDSAPWGYAPYHYGRWFYANAAWYWAPGFAAAPGPVYYNAPVVYAPHPVAYAPALVAFFSFGGGDGGGGFGIGFGNVGWCALAPAEAYRPWYGPRAYGNTYGTNVNVNVNVNFASAYRNAAAPGGAVAVNNGNFANGNFATIVRLRPSQLANVTPVRGVLPVVPTQANLAFRNHAAAAATGPVPSGRFARFATTPKSSAPSFAAQQHAVTAAAVKTFPEHAALFTHPALQVTADHPGLITTENAPEAFKPSATVRTNAPGTPLAPSATVRTNAPGAPLAPSATVRTNAAGAPLAPSTPATYGRPATASTADPFARFDHPSTTTVPKQTALPTYERTAPPPSYARPDDLTRTSAPAYRATLPPAYKATTLPTYAKPAVHPAPHPQPHPKKTPAA